MGGRSPWRVFLENYKKFYDNDLKCEIPPNLPLPKGGIVPLFGKEGKGEIF